MVGTPLLITRQTSLPSDDFNILYRYRTLHKDVRGAGKPTPSKPALVQFGVPSFCGFG